MALTLSHWSDEAAFQVLEHLDTRDALEVLALKGRAVGAWDLHAEWRALSAAGQVRIARWDGEPFAVVGVVNSGAVGVAQAALLAGDHRFWRWPLAVLGVHLGRVLPDFAREHALYRIEARAWAGHPGGGRLLAHAGFRLEAALGGYHPRGCGVFNLWAWTRTEAEDD